MVRLVVVGYSGFGYSTAQNRFRKGRAKRPSFAKSDAKPVPAVLPVLSTSG
jgi:hypothetical protein